MMPHLDVALEAVPVLLTHVFFTALWQGAAMVLAVEAVLRLLPRAGAQVRYAVLSAAFVLLTLLPWAHTSPTTPTPGHGSALQVLPIVATGIALVWVALAMVRAVQLFLAYRHLRAVWRRAVPLESVTAALEPLRPDRRHVVLCSSEDVDAPTVLGFRRPRLLLPAWLAPTLADADLEQIALHECEHLRRRDEWMNLLQQVALLLLPLHPALHWLNRRLNSERELACDAAVISRTGAPIVYASCLARLAEQRLERRERMRLALAAWERRSELAKRVHALLQTAANWTPQQSRWAVGTMVLVFAALSVTMARAPQVVRVAGADLPGAVTANPSTISASRPAVAGAVPYPGAIYHDAPATLVTASFREPVPHAAEEGKHAVVLPARGARRRRSGTRSGVLLTATPGRIPKSMVERPTRFETTEFTHAYAAVPFGDGWLFIQL